MKQHEKVKQTAKTACPVLFGSLGGGGGSMGGEGACPVLFGSLGVMGAGG